MEVVVVGMGYVGIPVAALFADVPGFNVTGLQRRSRESGWKIDWLNQGKSPIESEEPGLPELIKSVHEKGTFRVTDDLSCYDKADVILIAVQTPVDEDHKPRYESLRQVLTDIGNHLNKGKMVCLESTVAPGTTNYLAKPILEERSGLAAGVDFNLVFSYERVMVGRLLHNLKKYARIVGGITDQCTNRGIDFYRHIVEAELLPTDALTAEVSKVVENTYRDVNVAFANEVALICESLKVNVHDVRRFVNSLPNDPTNPAANPIRNLHIPGAGVGGHCLPKDPWLLKYGLDTYGEKKFEPRILMESRRTNEYMPRHMSDLIEDAIRERQLKPKESKITILGYAFLENSDDPRNTPTIPLYEILKKQYKQVIVHDPYIKKGETIEILNDLNDAIKDSHCIAIVTRHREYTILTPEALLGLMKAPIIVDGRNTLNPKLFREKGFIFRGVGIP